MKSCGRCHVVKSGSSFSKASREKDGLSWQCRECANRVYLAKRLETHSESMKWWAFARAIGLSESVVQESRFWSQVEQSGNCWRWSGGTNDKGYGLYHSDGPVGAHRVAYGQMVGEIPPGLELDHLCHNEDLSCDAGDGCIHRRCVKPSHLEPVSKEENTKRMNDRRAVQDGIRSRSYGACPTPA